MNSDLRNYGGNKNVTEWTSVLDLATRWEFANIREIAVQQLLPITTAVDRVVLGHRYDFTQWFLPAYIILCTQSKAINFEDGLRLGLLDVIRINEVRNGIHSRMIKGMGTRNGVSVVPSVTESVVEELVTSKFGLGPVESKLREVGEE